MAILHDHIRIIRPMANPRDAVADARRDRVPDPVRMGELDSKNMASCNTWAACEWLNADVRLFSPWASPQSPRPPPRRDPPGRGRPPYSIFRESYPIPCEVQVGTEESEDTQSERKTHP